MAKRNPITPGSRFGRLVVLKEIRERRTPAKALCACDCGQFTKTVVYHLRSGDAASCGCLKRDVNRAALLKHGAASRGKKSPLHVAWVNMKARCYNKNRPEYKDYGGRGIKVCERWLNSFEAFRADMGPRPDGATLDRIDNDKDYGPGNCRWASRLMQTENRRVTRMLEYRGEKLTIRGWAERLGLTIFAIRSRIDRKWRVEDILGRPMYR